MKTIKQIISRTDSMYIKDSFVTLSKEEWQTLKTAVLGTTPNKPNLPCDNCGDGRFLRPRETCLNCGRAFK